MIALGVVYPQYWVADPIASEETLKVAFCNPRKIGGLDQDVYP
jgi:hypothetical protein